MCFVSCARYDQGLFTAYRRLAEDRPDLVLHLGDYSYEYATDTTSLRQLTGGVELTLADYRRRYAQYHADPTWRPRTPPRPGSWCSTTTRWRTIGPT